MTGLEIPGFVFGAVSLASMFKTCLECVEYIEAGKDMSKDLSISLTLLNLQKCRLQLFGDKSGIFEPECSPGRSKYIDDPQYQLFVHTALQNILLLFRDSRVLEKRYGVGEHDSKTLLKRQPTEFRTTRNDDFREKYKTFIKSLSDKAMEEKIPDIESYAAEITKNQKGANFLIKTRWAIHDRSKFKELVEVVTRLIDALANFTGEERSIKNEIISEIRQMRDLIPLERIERACRKFDHALSTVAGGVIEVVSNAHSSELNEEELEIEIDRMTVVPDDSDWEDDEPDKTKDTIACSPTSKLDDGCLTKEATTQPDSYIEIAKKGTPSNNITRVFLIAHGSEGVDSMAGQPFVTEGELRTFTEPDFKPHCGILPAIRLARECSEIFYNVIAKKGQKYCYVAPTSSHIELSIAISEKSLQPPVIRIDHHLLWKHDDAVLPFLETANDVLGEREMNAFSSHGLMLGHSGQLWPTLLRHLDTKYLDNLIPIEEDKEAGKTVPGDAQSFGLHSIFAMHRDGDPDCYGDIIVIADRGMIQELVNSPLVQVACDVRAESITQLHRLPRDSTKPDVQFWRADRWAGLGRR